MHPVADSLAYAPSDLFVPDLGTNKIAHILIADHHADYATDHFDPDPVTNPVTNHIFPDGLTILVPD